MCDPILVLQIIVSPLKSLPDFRGLSVVALDPSSVSATSLKYLNISSSRGFGGERRAWSQCLLIFISCPDTGVQPNVIGTYHGVSCVIS